MKFSTFNDLAPQDARRAVLTCAGIPRWADAVVAARPYVSGDDALQQADALARRWSDDEVDSALADHPRIGEKREQQDELSAASDAEQAGVARDQSTQERLRDANTAYEERFDRVFLIRAAGRDAEQILAEAERRLALDDDAERREVAEQLRQIALLRLAALLETEPLETKPLETHRLEGGLAPS